MERDRVLELAAQAGLFPWVKHEWSQDRFVHTDEGIDGDLACLIQFAELVAAARVTIADAEELDTAIRARGEG